MSWFAQGLDLFLPFDSWVKKAFRGFFLDHLFFGGIQQKTAGSNFFVE